MASYWDRMTSTSYISATGVFLINVACGWLCSRIATRKDIRDVQYTTVGLMLGPIGLLAVIFAKPFGIGTSKPAKPSA
jgi:hypothetical protein